MRSAVPLGGISTGSTELRANGVFHEWTIQNRVTRNKYQGAINFTLVAHTGENQIHLV